MQACSYCWAGNLVNFSVCSIKRKQNSEDNPKCTGFQCETMVTRAWQAPRPSSTLHPVCRASVRLFQAHIRLTFVKRNRRRSFSLSCLHSVPRLPILNCYCNLVSCSDSRTILLSPMTDLSLPLSRFSLMFNSKVLGKIPIFGLEILNIC